MSASSRSVLRRLASHRPLLIARNLQSSTNPKPLVARVFTSSYLWAGLLAWTGFGAYFLFPPKYAPSDPQKLSPTRFNPVSLISSEVTSKNTRLLTLAVPRNLRPQNDTTSTPIWSIYVKDDDIQVERPYTPLEGIDDKGHIKLWVKKYPKGEVGRWLHSKSPGDVIEIRGPLMTWPWKGDAWDEVVMISGGTGITPFNQLLHHELLRKPSSHSRTRFTLLHSSPSPGELPPSTILDPLKTKAREEPDRFRLKLFVDSLDEMHASSEGLQVGRIDQLAIEQALDARKPSGWDKAFQQATDYTRGRKVLFLVCGPDPMISAIAGPWGRNFSQGRIEGILGTMGFGPGDVRKL